MANLAVALPQALTPQADTWLGTRQRISSSMTASAIRLESSVSSGAKNTRRQSFPELRTLTSASRHRRAKAGRQVHASSLRGSLAPDRLLSPLQKRNEQDGADAAERARLGIPPQATTRASRPSASPAQRVSTGIWNGDVSRTRNASPLRPCGTPSLLSCLARARLASTTFLGQPLGCPRGRSLEAVESDKEASLLVRSSSASNPSQGKGSSAGASAEPRAVPLAPFPQETKVAEEAQWRMVVQRREEEEGEERRVLGKGDQAEEEEESEEEALSMDPVKLAQFLDSSLPSHPKLHRGVLDNGLRYVILPNTVPPNRFEAHLEMHVGSVDEEEQEQGLAHLIEHVTFLGSRKRERLLGTGARSNAYTDFHHTVFHVHAPCTQQGSGEAMLPLVLQALHEIAFQPRFLPSRIDKERRAVLSESQMMNTIEYRVDCQLLQFLHSENRLGCRFPIGKEEQVPKWGVDTIKAFHQRWYYPANATLYVVGDIGSVSLTIKLIQKEFGRIPPAYEVPQASLSQAQPLPSPGEAPALAASSLPAGPPPSTPPTSSPLSSSSSPLPFPPSQPTSVPLPLKQRHAVRPPVAHRWSRQHLAIAPAEAPSSAGPSSPGYPTIFRHELLQNFSLTVFCKNPVKPVKRFEELRAALMARIASYALQFRINKRYKSGEVPFMSISLDHSDSAREGCTVSTLTVLAEAEHWEGAVRLAVQEVRRLKEFGLTAGELTRYLTALMKDSEHVAAMIGTIPSLDNLDFIMENDALGHTIMDQEQAHECLSAVAPTVTLEDVNDVAASVLEYIADYGRPGAPEPAATVACVPAHMHQSEDRAAKGGPAGSVPFVITPEQIHSALHEGLAESLLPEPEVEVPKALLPEAELARLMATAQPHFVPLSFTSDASKALPLSFASSSSSSPVSIISTPSPSDGDSPNGAPFSVPPLAVPLRDEDPETGIIQRQLSNGIRINMKVTENEAKGGMMRLVVPGGRAEETAELPGAVAIGVRTLSESGSVGDFTLEQVELFCLANQINCALEADEEFICLDFHFTSRHGGLRATFQLIHMVLEHSVWHEDALDRAKQLYLSHFRSLPKSLERYTAYTMMKVMFGGDQRLLEPEPAAIAKLTLEGVKDAVMKQLRSGHMEVSVVGDMSIEEVEQYALQYLGTISALPPTGSAPWAHGKAIPIVDVCDPALRNQKVLLRDTDERARAYVAAAAPNRWGLASDGRDANTVMEPVPMSLPTSTSAAEMERGGVLGRFIKGLFKGDEAKGRQSGAVEQGMITRQQAQALAPLGVSVVEGPSGQLFWRRKRHPLFASTAMMLLTEIMNARLFTTVRDALGLTYDVSFEISTFERLPMGWFVISVTSTPAKIQQALEASINVLQGLQANRITQRELDRAKRTLLMRHESDLKDNSYWLGLLTHIQSDAVPRKDVGSIGDLQWLYEVMSIEDIYSIYDQLSLDSPSLFTCIGIAGPGVQDPQGPLPVVEEDESMPTDVFPAGAPMHGRGSSMITRPTE